MGFDRYHRWARSLDDACELVFPRRCAGCGAPGEVLCSQCRDLWRAVPHMISTRVTVDVPLWSLGPWGGVRRATIIALKERGRRDVIEYVAAVLYSSVRFLIAQGNIDDDIVLVPAPTKKSSARRRGGDIVGDVCRACGIPTVELMWLKESVRESVGLSPAQRRQNLSGAVMLDAQRCREITGCVLLVDDVITTGATMRSAIMKLQYQGVRVRGGLGWAHA